MTTLTEEDKQRWRQAVQLVEMGEIRPAIDLFKPIQHARAQANCGILYLTLREYRKAHLHFSNAMKSDLYFALVHFARGVCVAKDGMYEHAVPDFSNAHKLVKAKGVVDYSLMGLGFRLYDSEILFNRALVHIAMGDLGKAREDASEALAALAREDKVPPPPGSPQSEGHAAPIAALAKILNSANGALVDLAQYQIFTVPKSAVFAPVAIVGADAAKRMSVSVPGGNVFAGSLPAPLPVSPEREPEIPAKARQHRMSAHERRKDAKKKKKKKPSSKSRARKISALEDSSVRLGEGGPGPSDMASDASMMQSVRGKKRLHAGLVDQLNDVSEPGLIQLVVELSNSSSKARKAVEAQLPAIMAEFAKKPQVDTVKVRQRVREAIQSIIVMTENDTERSTRAFVAQTRTYLKPVLSFVNRTGLMAKQGDYKGALTVLEAVTDEFSSRWVPDPLLEREEQDFYQAAWAKWIEVLEAANFSPTDNLIWLERALRLDQAGDLDAILPASFREPAREARMKTFIRAPGLAAYRRLVAFAEDRNELRNRVLAKLPPGETRLIIDIFLNDGLLDDAISRADAAKPPGTEDRSPEEEKESLLRHVGHNVAAGRPDWVLNTAKRIVPEILNWILVDAKDYFDIDNFDLSDHADTKASFLDQISNMLSEDAAEGVETGPDLFRKLLRWFKNIMTATSTDGSSFTWQSFVSVLQVDLNHLVAKVPELLYVMKETVAEGDGEWWDIRNLIQAISENRLEDFVESYE